MKKMTMILVLIFLSFIFIGCMHQGGSSGVTWGDYKYDLKYENMRVEETHDFQMSKGDNFKISVITELGKLKVTIEDSDGNEIYSGSDIPTSEFKVKVNKDDTYTINIYGRKVTGDFHIRLTGDR